MTSPGLKAACMVQIEELDKLSRAEVKALWEKLFGHPITLPPRLDFTIRVIAYRLQELEFGGLSTVTRRRLLKIAAAVEADPNCRICDVPQIRPGTRLVREWRGKTHTVEVGEQGFQYNGGSYRSLSQVARLITGTQWSGPRFFGLGDNHG